MTVFLILDSESDLERQEFGMASEGGEERESGPVPKVVKALETITCHLHTEQGSQFEVI